MVFGPKDLIRQLSECLIYLQNTNLALNHQLTHPKYGDFMVDNKNFFEVGGPNKTSHQFNGIPNAYIAADGIKAGSGNKIPLWLFGLLY